MLQKRHDESIDFSISDIEMLLKYLVLTINQQSDDLLKSNCIKNNILTASGRITDESFKTITFLQTEVLNHEYDFMDDDILKSINVSEIIHKVESFFSTSRNHSQTKEDDITNLQNKEDGKVGSENILPMSVGSENILPMSVGSQTKEDDITNLQNKEDDITNLQNKGNIQVGKHLVKKHILKLLNDIKIVADNLRQDGDKRRFTKNAFNNIIKDLLSSNQFDLRHVENAPIKYGKIGTYKSDLSILRNHLSWVYLESTGLYILNEDKFYKDLANAKLISKAAMIEKAESNKEQQKKAGTVLTEFSEEVAKEIKSIENNVIDTGYLRYNFSSESLSKLFVAHELLENSRQYLDEFQDKYFNFWLQKSKDTKQREVSEYPLLNYELENIPVGAKEFIQYPNDKKVGKIITIEAEILETTALKNMTYCAQYYSNTGRSKHVKIDRNDKKVAEYIKETVYDESGTAEEIKWELICKYRIPYQEILVQQPLDLLDSLVSPKPIKCIWKGSEGIFEESSGKVRITGILDVDKSDEPITPYIIDILQVEMLEEFSTQTLAQEDVKKAKDYFSERNVGSISNELIPMIKGKDYDLLKKVIVFQQCNIQDRKANKNNNLHILMVTDPGMGKSDILSRIADLFPNNQYADMGNATQAGIAAALERQEGLLGNAWVLVRGALPRAHCGTACLDEKPGKYTLSNIKYINEAMQNGKITITKAKTSSIPANMAILWGCNPKFEKLDPNLTVNEQIEFPDSTLSRFDIIWVKEDKASLEDREAIETMLLEEDEVFKEVDEEGLKRYILYARTLQPTFTKTITNEIIEYVLRRRANNNINKRLANTIKKLCIASAKANLRSEVTTEDYREAIEIYEYFLDTVLRDPETGLYDQGKIVGIPQSRLDKMDKIKKAIERLAERSIKGLADLEDVIKEVKQYNISEDETAELVEKLKKSAEIFSPKTGYYKIV